MLTTPDDAALIETRDALRRMLGRLHWHGGEAPPLWTHGVETLRRIEDALGETHTYPRRAERLRRGGEELCR